MYIYIYIYIIQINASRIFSIRDLTQPVFFTNTCGWQNQFKHDKIHNNTVLPKLRKLELFPAVLLLSSCIQMSMLYNTLQIAHSVAYCCSPTSSRDRAWSNTFQSIRLQFATPEIPSVQPSRRLQRAGSA